MIPPKFYFPADPEEMARKFQKFVGKQPQMPKHDRKLQANERKRARLDPGQTSVPEELVLRNEREQEAVEAEAEADDAHLMMVHGVMPGALNRGGSAATPAGLRDRLAEKLQLLRGSRGGTAAGRESDGQARAKKEKQQKHKAAKRAREPESQESGWASAEGAGGTSSAGSSRSCSGIEFNKLAAAASAPIKASKRKLSTAQLLAHAEEKERLRRARLAAPDGGGEDAQIGEWQKALEKAGGIKQKDNPKLLKKTLKRKERQKKKSSREWKARTKQVDKQKREKQEKRTTNLAERKTKNKVRSANQKKRAGFEGKRNFLN